MYLTLSIVCGWEGATAWAAVGFGAVMAAIYTSLGGLRSVAVTAPLQFGVMSAVGLVIWFTVWSEVGDWEGMARRLAERDQDLPAQLLHVGRANVESIDVSGETQDFIDRKLLVGGEYDAAFGTIVRRTPAWLIALGLIAMGMAYSNVNHTQAMSMFASRSEWDLKMCVVVVVAGLAMNVMSFFKSLNGGDGAGPGARVEHVAGR